MEMVRITLGHVLEQDEDSIDGHANHLFDQLDRLDGCPDGRIESAKLIELLAILDGRKNSYNIITARTIAENVDKNHDGYLSRLEFKDLLRELDQLRPQHSRRNNFYLRRPVTIHRASLRRYISRAAKAEEYTCWPPPFFIFSVTMAQIGFFLFHMHHFLTEHNVSFTWHGPYPVCSKLIFNPYKRWALWRFVSYSFVHAGLEHMIVNMSLQLLVGVILEMSNGWFRVFIIYTAGVLSGSLGTSIFRPCNYLAGASGGVFALLGAHLASVILNWKDDKLVMRERLRTRLICHPEIIPTKSSNYRIVRVVFVIVLCFLDFGKSLYDPHSDAFEASRTSILAHLCGFFTGITMGMAILRNRKVDPWERKVKRLSVILLTVAAIFAVSWNIFGDVILQKVTGHEDARYFNMPDYTPDKHHGECKIHTDDRCINGDYHHNHAESRRYF